MENGFSTLSPVGKRAVFKVAIELVKADNRIHRQEISALDRLREDFGLTQAELDLTHYVSLADAVEIIRGLDRATAGRVLDMLSGLMRADSDVDFDENLLLAAIQMACEDRSRDWCSVVSAVDMNFDVSARQIVYLEKKPSEEARDILNDPYENLLLSKAFGDIGLELFYLPGMIRELSGKGAGTERVSLLRKSMEYLMPAGDKRKAVDLERLLDSFDIPTFLKVFLSRSGLSPDFFPFDAFLLVKIRDSIILDDDNGPRSEADFLCIDLSSQVRERIRSFVSRFGEPAARLPYDGYFNLLYDYLSAESQILSDICLDGNFQFRLQGLGNRTVVFESSPQVRTLYLLLLRAGAAGITQDTFKAAVRWLSEADLSPYQEDGHFDTDRFMASLRRAEDAPSCLLYNTVAIYRHLSTKDDWKAGFLSYIASILQHRSSLKTYANKGFDAVEGLSNRETYHILFDREANAYKVTASASLFRVDRRDGQVPLEETRFWASLL